MKLKIVESHPIDNLFKTSEHTSCTRMDKTSFSTNRRKFLKLAGMVGIGASVAGLSNLL